MSKNHAEFYPEPVQLIEKNANHKTWKPLESVFLRTGLELFDARFPDLETLLNVDSSTHFIQKSKSEKNCREKQKNFEKELSQTKLRNLSESQKRVKNAMKH